MQPSPAHSSGNRLPGIFQAPARDHDGVICGGGLEKAQVDKGRIATAKFIRLAVREYMERIAAAGLAGHATRSRIPAMIDRISASA